MRLIVASLSSQTRASDLSVARTNHFFQPSGLFLFFFFRSVLGSKILSFIRLFDQRHIADDFDDPVKPAAFPFLFAALRAASVRR